jgi:hypothetical protein
MCWYGLQIKWDYKKYKCFVSYYCNNEVHLTVLPQCLLCDWANRRSACSSIWTNNIHVHSRVTPSRKVQGTNWGLDTGPGTLRSAPGRDSNRIPGIKLPAELARSDADNGYNNWPKQRKEQTAKWESPVDLSAECRAVNTSIAN